MVSLQEQWKTSFWQVFSDDPDLLNKSNQFGARQRIVRVSPAGASPGQGSRQPAELAEQQPVEEVFLLVSELWQLFGEELGWGQWFSLQLNESEILLSSHSRKEVVTGESSRLRTEEEGFS